MSSKCQHKVSIRIYDKEEEKVEKKTKRVGNYLRCDREGEKCIQPPAAGRWGDADFLHSSSLISTYIQCLDVFLHSGYVFYTCFYYIHSLHI